MLKDAVHDVLLRIDSSVAARPEFVPAKSDREFRLFVSDFTLATLVPHMLALARAHAQGPNIRAMARYRTRDPGIAWLQRVFHDAVRDMDGPDSMLLRS